MQIIKQTDAEILISMVMMYTQAGHIYIERDYNVLCFNRFHKNVSQLLDISVFTGKTVYIFINSGTRSP